MTISLRRSAKASHVVQYSVRIDSVFSNNIKGRCPHVMSRRDLEHGLMTLNYIEKCHQLSSLLPANLDFRLPLYLPVGLNSLKKQGMKKHI